MFFGNIITAGVWWKYADNFYTITPRTINYISKCLSQNALLNTAIKGGTGFMVNIYQIVSNFNSQRVLDVQSCFMYQVNCHYESLELVFLCLKIWSMLKVSWRKQHPVQFLKAPQMTKAGILQLKISVDLMPAATKIHSKIKSQQLPHVKSTETVQGPNHRTGERGYPRRVLSYDVVRMPVKGLTREGTGYGYKMQ